MEIANLVLDFVRVLTWPIVVITLAVLLRHRLQELLSRLTSAEALGARAEFAVQGALASDLSQDPATDILEHSDLQHPENASNREPEEPVNEKVSTTPEEYIEKDFRNPVDQILIPYSNFPKNASKDFESDYASGLEQARIHALAQWHDPSVAIQKSAGIVRRYLARTSHLFGLNIPTASIKSGLPLSVLPHFPRPQEIGKNQWSLMLMLSRTLDKRASVLRERNYEPSQTDAEEYARDAIRLLQMLERLARIKSSSELPVSDGGLF